MQTIMFILDPENDPKYSPCGTACLCCVGSRWFVICAILIGVIASIDLIKLRLNISADFDFKYEIAIDILGIAAGIIGILGGVSANRIMVMIYMGLTTGMAVSRIIFMIHQMVVFHGVRDAVVKAKLKSVEEADRILTGQLIDSGVSTALIVCFYSFGVYTGFKFKQFLVAIDIYDKEFQAAPAVPIIQPQFGMVAYSQPMIQYPPAPQYYQPPQPPPPPPYQPQPPPLPTPQPQQPQVPSPTSQQPNITVNVVMKNPDNLMV